MRATEVNDGAIDLRALLQVAARHTYGMWRFRWFALALAWVASISSVVAIYLMPNRFEASAQVFVDTDSVLRPLLRGLSVEKDVMNDVAVMTRTLVTRPNVERVARETDLDIRASTPAEFDAIVASLQRKILVAGSGQNIYTISFQDERRETAVAVVTKLLDSFVENTLGSGTEDSQQAERTLKAELADYERRLTESEDRLKEFKRKNVGLMPDEHGDYYAQLQAAMSDLSSVQQQIRIATEKEASLSRQLAGEEPVFGIMPTSANQGTSVDAQITALEQRRSDLLVGFTEKHPEVVRVDQMLKDLRVKQQAEIAARPADAMPMITNPQDVNPVYQNMKIQRSKVEVELATLRATLVEKQSAVEKLKKMVDVIPQIEAELNRLNRDYDVVKARYGQMLQRWEDLQTGKRVKSGADEVQFRVINPPFSSSEPSGPPRALYIFGSLVGSLGLGVAVAFLLNLLRPVYHQARELREHAVPILGSVQISESADVKAQRRSSNLLLAGVTVGLIAFVGVLMGLARIGSDLLRSVI